MLCIVSYTEAQPWIRQTSLNWTRKGKSRETPTDQPPLHPRHHRRLVLLHLHHCRSLPTLNPISSALNLNHWAFLENTLPLSQLPRLSPLHWHRPLLCLFIRIHPRHLHIRMMMEMKREIWDQYPQLDQDRAKLLIGPRNCFLDLEPPVHTLADRVVLHLPKSLTRDHPVHLDRESSHQVLC